MGFFELAITALALSMDAFAVSICTGIELKDRRVKHYIVIGLYFGIFQGLMPLGGYFLGAQLKDLLDAVDHWIAFILLALIGGKMLYEALRGGEDGESCPTAQQGNPLRVGKMVQLSIATSIDAFAVGVSFAFYDTNITLATLLIGSVTFAMCVVGSAIGGAAGSKLQGKAEIVGGVVLILMGLRMLIFG